jgi:chromosomal replication initiator protein
MNTAQTITKTPLWVIENQTLKIIRLENEIRLRDREIKNLEDKVLRLQKELVAEKVKKAPRVVEVVKVNRPVRVRVLSKEVLRKEDILSGILGYYCKTLPEVVVPSRKRSIAEVRNWICYFLGSHTTMTYLEIGNMLGGRDHSTVINAIRNIRDGLDSNESTAVVRDILLSKIKSKAL